MDVLSFLSYINKFSLLAFFITTLVVGYQIYNLKKEKKIEQKPSIPDFKDTGKSPVANYTRLPDFLTKKKTSVVNYSKMIFLIIILLTAGVVIVVLTLIKRNSSLQQSSTNETTTENSARLAVNQISPTVMATAPPRLSPTSAVTPTVSPTPLISPTISISPVVTKALTPSPTEIVLAKAVTLTPTTGEVNLSPTNGAIKTLPETGSLEKVFLMIGVAVSTIFFSFWL